MSDIPTPNHPELLTDVTTIGFLVEQQQQVEAYRQRVGGLPEITEASTALAEVLRATADEIETADFAERFKRPLNDYESVLAFGGLGKTNVLLHAATDEEGLAGAKRLELRAQAQALEVEFALFVTHLLDLRTHLRVSCMEFDEDLPPAED